MKKCEIWIHGYISLIEDEFIPDTDKNLNENN